MRYAQYTDVSSDRSKAEIENLLLRYGADQFVSGWDNQCARIGFRIRDRHVRFVLPLPKKDDPRFKKTPTGRVARNPDQWLSKWEQDCRQRWRALALVIKAKLEAVESNITTFEDEFMAHIVMPNGKTVAEMIGPAIDSAYKSGKMPTALLPGW